MTDYDPNLPDGNKSIRLGDDDTRANFLAIEERVSVEHQFPANADAQKGRHKFGMGANPARAAAFPSPVAGNVWFHSQTLQWEVYDGTAWRPQGPAIGDIKFTAHATGAADLGSGWIRADGRVLSQTTYAKLFTVCGSAFNIGGEGAGNFRIPDLRGRTPVGHHQGGDGGGDYGTPGGTYGAKTVTLDISQVPAHDHGGATGDPTTNPTVVFSRENNGSGALFHNSVRKGDTTDFTNVFDITLPDHEHSIPSQGGGGSHENRPPLITLVAHIYTGV